MNTYDVTYWLDGDAHTDTVDGESSNEVELAVLDRHPDADVWGSRAQAVVYETNGKVPCAEAMAKIIEEMGTARRWYIVVARKGNRINGEITAVDADSIGVYWYDRTETIPWSDVTAVSITARF
jgi:hypothetical protein